MGTVRMRVQKHYNINPQVIHTNPDHQLTSCRGSICDKNVMLHFSKSVWIKRQTHLGQPKRGGGGGGGWGGGGGRGGVQFQQMFIYG